MATWISLGSTRHQVAIAGRVTDGHSGKPLARARVEITAAPAAFTDWLALQAAQQGDRWAGMAERPDRKLTAADGHFHFMDLPDGAYTLSISLPEFGSRYGTASVAAVVSRDGSGKIIMASADAALAPTTVAGVVTDAVDGTFLAMATVRVLGSGEAAQSDAAGSYALAGLESGARRLTASFAGYDSQVKSTTLSSPGATQTLNFALSGTPVTPFLPTDVAGCQLWLDAGAIGGVSSGSGLATWPDGSGNGWDATQNTASRQPLYVTNLVNGRAAVRFDGSDDNLALALVEASTDHTFFFVCNLAATGGHNNYLFEAQTGRLSLDAAGQAAPHPVRWQDAVWHDMANAITGWQILTWRLAGAAGEVFRNGSSIGSDAYAPTALGGRVVIGANNTGTGSRFGGDLAEVIYYNRSLSVAERQQVEQYLSNRYAIALA